MHYQDFSNQSALTHINMRKRYPDSESKTVREGRPSRGPAGRIWEDEEYINMLNSLEAEKYKFAPEELTSISGYKTDLSLITLETWTRLIIRNGCEILLP